MTFPIAPLFVAAWATLTPGEEEAGYWYWFGGQFVALLLAVPLFLKLYRQHKGMEWKAVLREEWKVLLPRLVTALLFVVVFGWAIETGPVGLVGHLQTTGAFALLMFYFVLAPVMAYYASRWKKRTSAWALLAFLPGPAALLFLLLLPEREGTHRAVLSDDLGRSLLDGRPASPNPPEDLPTALRKLFIQMTADFVLYVVIGLVFLALLIWFVISTRPSPLH